MKPQPRKTKPARRTRQRRLPAGCAQYTEMKGRTVEGIEVYLSSDYHCVSIRFEDKTDFTVEIDTRVVCQAFHSDWKNREHARAEALASHRRVATSLPGSAQSSPTRVFLHGSHAPSQPAQTRDEKLATEAAFLGNNILDTPD